MKSFVDAVNKAHKAEMEPVEWRIPKFAVELSGRMLRDGLPLDMLLGVPVVVCENSDPPRLVCKPKPRSTDILL